MKPLLIKLAIALSVIIPTAFLFQNCSQKTKFSQLPSVDLASAAAQACPTPGAAVSCIAGNGSGVAICSSTHQLGTCVLQSCDSGFNLNNGICLPNQCTPNSIAACFTATGSGTKTCLSSGAGFGSCSINSCNTGYTLQNGICVANACTPNTSASCTTATGAGTYVCNASGTGYGACNLSSCNSGYHLTNGTCAANACTPNTTAACTSGVGSGSMTCNSQGVGYGSCQISSCQTGYNLQNGTCMANACSPNMSSACHANNGTGTQYCNASGTANGACTLTGCDSGYSLSNGQCISNACSPNSTSTCTSSTGSGLQTCNASGTGFGSCLINKCNTGYNLQNGVCVANACTPNTGSVICNSGNGIGYQLCNASGTGYGACTITGCKSGYNFTNGQCTAAACTANQSIACSESNGTGSKTCNSSGTAYGSCILNSCSSGYNFQNGICVQNVCAANTDKAFCSDATGSGTKTCNSNGTAYNSCVFTSCSTGYTLSGSTCVKQVETPYSAMYAASIAKNPTSTTANQVIVSTMGSLSSHPFGPYQIQVGVPNVDGFPAESDCQWNGPWVNVPVVNGAYDSSSTFSYGVVDAAGIWPAGYSSSRALCYRYKSSTGLIGPRNVISVSYSNPNTCISGTLTSTFFSQLVKPGADLNFSLGTSGNPTGWEYSTNNGASWTAASLPTTTKALPTPITYNYITRLVFGSEKAACPGSFPVQVNVDGVCGEATGTTYGLYRCAPLSGPSFGPADCQTHMQSATYYCAVGTIDKVPVGANGKYPTWTCSGVNGGAPVTCSGF